MVDLGDGGTSESESTKSDEAAKKSIEKEKGPKTLKLISQAPNNPFSSTTKTLTLVKKKIFSVDTLSTTSKVIGTESWLENTLDRKGKWIEGVPNKETLSLAIHFGSALRKVKK